MDAIVCTRDTAAIAVVVVVSEDRSGSVAEIHISVDVPGAATTGSERDRLDRIRELTGLPFADPSAAASARAWLAGLLPLAAGDQTRVTIDATPILVERVPSGGYRIVLRDLGAGASVVRSP